MAQSKSFEFSIWKKKRNDFTVDSLAFFFSVVFLIVFDLSIRVEPFLNVPFFFFLCSTSQKGSSKSNRVHLIRVDHQQLYGFQNFFTVPPHCPIRQTYFTQLFLDQNSIEKNLSISSYLFRYLILYFFQFEEKSDGSRETFPYLNDLFWYGSSLGL